MQPTLAAPGTTRIGWIGTGVMGRSMCGHLLAAGYRVVVHNRTRDRADALLASGAAWADSAREVTERSDVVIAMVGLPAEARDVFLGEVGALAGVRPGTILIDMATNPPQFARELAAAAAARSAFAIDAPVSGGDVGARNAQLSIMVGGDAAAVRAAWPLFERTGKTIVHQGAAGAGQHTKLVNQVLIASNMVGVCEALLYAKRAGLNPIQVLESVSGGAAASWSLSNLAPRILDRNFEPGFFVEHFLKDMAIALEESRRMGIALPGLALAEQLYRAVAAQGYGRKGTQALMLALETMSHVTG
jgi:3-hydroxyisobutyrate dehydrogenase